MNCQIFLAQADANGFPIPGTMQGYNSNPCQPNLVQLPSSTPATPPGYMICRSPSGLRYFVQVNSNGIISNSLQAYTCPPSNGACYAEFLKFVPAP